MRELRREVSFQQLAKHTAWNRLCIKRHKMHIVPGLHLLVVGSDRSPADKSSAGYRAVVDLYNTILQVEIRWFDINTTNFKYQRKRNACCTFLMVQIYLFSFQIGDCLDVVRHKQVNLRIVKLYNMANAVIYCSID